MRELNKFQKEFMETLASIQEVCVQGALCQKYEKQSLEDRFYDLTSNVIVDIMEVIDGYNNSNIGKLNVICEKTGECLKDEPFIELHDVVCEYLNKKEVYYGNIFKSN